MIPSFLTRGVPEYPAKAESGTTGLAGGAAMAIARSFSISCHDVYTASGITCRVRSTFSGTPPTKTMGTERVASRFRSRTARSRPCDGIRPRSITKASGMSPNSCRRPAGEGAPCSTSWPAVRRRSPRSAASASFQCIRRTRATRSSTVPADSPMLPRRASLRGTASHGRRTGRGGVHRPQPGLTKG